MSEIISRKEAMAQGLKRYFGKLCCHGHGRERWVCDRGCVECQKIKTRRCHAARRIRDPDWTRRVNAEMHEKHYEQRLQKLREASLKRTVAIGALRAVGAVKDKKRTASRPDNHIKRRSYKKRLIEDPTLRERRNASARDYYWRNLEKCQVRHRDWSRETTVCLLTLKEFGIEV